MRILPLCVLLLAGTLKPQLDNLIQAERDFAQLSMSQGIRPAFLANLGEDSIIFRPTAVPGRQWFESNPPATSQLNWAPEYADISSAGDLGYTTGSWERRQAGQRAPSSFGHYVTLWRKQADGKWKVELDTGISHAAVQLSKSVESPQIDRYVESPRSANEIEAARSAVAGIEKGLASSPQAILPLLASDARLYRDGMLPVIGQNAIRKTLAGAGGSFTRKLAKVEVSNRADLAYSYGTADLQPADPSKPVETSNFVRIWKKSGRSWKVVLDLLD
jgi:ketosteroid isomerase-like protein